MMRHGPFPGLGPAAGHRPLESIPPHLLENKIAVQETEIERLAGDNHRLAATHVSLKQEFVAAQQEVQELKAHIRSIQTESDIQIRVLLDKITKMEAEIRAGESVKKDLQWADIEAQSLAAARQELTGRIQQATQELQKARLDVKSLPDLQDELDSLRQEHQRLRATFEYEKNMNIEQVQQMKATERNLIGMAIEVQKLRAEVLEAEKRAHTTNPYGGVPPIEGSGTYMDGYERHQVQMAIGPVGEAMVPYGGSNGVADVPTAPAAGGDAVWGVRYDASVAPM